MSIRADILEAKADYEDHQGRHHCVTGDGCSVRIGLWKRYMDTAQRWGQEPDDAQRVREAYAWHTAILNSRAPALVLRSQPARYLTRVKPSG